MLSGSKKNLVLHLNHLNTFCFCSVFFFKFRQKNLPNYKLHELTLHKKAEGKKIDKIAQTYDCFLLAYFDYNTINQSIT